MAKNSTVNTDVYVEWYKKYRPKVWCDVIGQDKTVQALIQDIKYDAVPTAYIFKGMYGSGKTTAAFILAKAINCENPPGNSDPCNTCDTCLAIDSKSQLGFTYISGANNGSVESVRKLVTEQGYSQPIKKKVVILDEAHNLSSEALDSLLIPLESDNTKDVVYIICTTDVRKIKATVVSRSKTRSFNPLTHEHIMEVMRRVASREQFELTDNITEWVCRKANGSARQAVSLLEDAYRNGMSELSYGEQILNALEKVSIIKALEVVAEASQAGAPPEELTEQLIDDLTTILLLASQVDVSIAGESIHKNPQGFCDSVGGRANILQGIKMFSEAYNDMRTANSAKVLLNATLIDYVTFLSQSRKN